LALASWGLAELFYGGRQKINYECIINSSAISRFFLELQVCFAFHFKESSLTASWFDNRIGDASTNMAKKTG
jgi:hypothetical protein